MECKVLMSDLGSCAVPCRHAMVVAHPRCSQPIIFLMLAWL